MEDEWRINAALMEIKWVQRDRNEEEEKGI
jgi:hypothetical protein